MFKLNLVGKDMTTVVKEISSHKSYTTAYKRMIKEAKSLVKEIPYVRVNAMGNGGLVFDFGLWARFLQIVPIDEPLLDVDKVVELLPEGRNLALFCTANTDDILDYLRTHLNINDPELAEKIAKDCVKG